MIAKMSVPASDEIPSKKIPFLPVLTRQLLGRIRVKDVIKKPVYFYSHEKVDKIIEFMEKNNREDIIIVDKELKPVGLVRLKELKEHLDISKAIKPLRIIARQEDDLYTILEEIAVVNQPIIPVVDKNQKIIGEITLQDIISYIVAKKK